MGFTSKISRLLQGKSASYQSGASVDEKRANMMAQFGGVDELGFPDQGKNPPGEIADQVQLLAERTVARRNARLDDDALAALQGGLGNLQSYRPGGAAAMASPYYSQMAQVLQNSKTSAPDLLYNSRLDAQRKASKAARQASNMQIAGAVIQAAGMVLAPATGGASILASTAINAGLNSAAAGANAKANAASQQANTGASSGQPPQGQPLGAQPGAEAFGGQPSQPNQQQPGQPPQPNQGQGQGQPQGQGQKSLGGGGFQPQGDKGFQVNGNEGGGEAQGFGAGGGAQASGGSGLSSAMLDPSASAFGPATPAGSAYPSREGAIAAGTARYGPSSYDIVSQIYVRDFGDDGFYDRQLSSLDVIDAQIASLIA